MFLNCDVGEDPWESLGLQEIKPVHSKINQLWIFTGRTDADWNSNTLATWLKSWFTGKDSDVGKDWRQRRRRRRRMRWLDSITDSMTINLTELWEIVGDRETWHAAVHGGHKELDTLSKWTTTTIMIGEMGHVGDCNSRNSRKCTLGMVTQVS